MRLKLKRNWRWQDHSNAAIHSNQENSKEQRALLTQSDHQIILSGILFFLKIFSYCEEVRLNLIEDKLELDDETSTIESPVESPKEKEEKTV